MFSCWDSCLLRTLLLFSLGFGLLCTLFLFKFSTTTLTLCLFFSFFPRFRCSSLLVNEDDANILVPVCALRFSASSRRLQVRRCKQDEVRNNMRTNKCTNTDQVKVIATKDKCNYSSYYYWYRYYPGSGCTGSASSPSSAFPKI